MSVLHPFCSPADVMALTGCDDATADIACRVASKSVRNAVGWDVDLKVGAVYEKLYERDMGRVLGGLDPALGTAHLPGHPRRPSIVLPVMNLTAVASVLVDDRALTAEEWDATHSGVVYLTVYPHRKARITYTGGYRRRPEDEAPGVFEEVALEQAVAWASNPTNVKAVTLVGAAETLADRVPPVEDTRLDPYRVNL